MRFPEYIKSYILDFSGKMRLATSNLWVKIFLVTLSAEKTCDSSLNGHGDLFFPSMERRNCHIRSTYCLLLQIILSLFASGKGFIGTLF